MADNFVALRPRKITLLASYRIPRSEELSTGVPGEAWRCQVSNYAVLKSWFAGREDWTATPSQSKQATHVVSAVIRHKRIEAALDPLLVDVTATA